MLVSQSDAESASIIGDEEKCFRNDISCAKDEDHSPGWVFRTEVDYCQDCPLFVSS